MGKAQAIVGEERRVESGDSMSFYIFRDDSPDIVNSSELTLVEV